MQKDISNELGLPIFDIQGTETTLPNVTLNKDFIYLFFWERKIFVFYFLSVRILSKLVHPLAISFLIDKSGKWSRYLIGLLWR